MTTRIAPSGRTTADGAIRFGRSGRSQCDRVGARGPRGLVRAAILAAVLVGSGCVERTLLITSDPLGAHVTLNGKDVGLTPVTVPFIHNQRFEYRIEKNGYRSVAGDVTTPSTWDSVPGLDFFAENAYPGRIRRQTTHYVTLERLSAAPTRADLEAKLRQAEAFRVRAETETGGADIPAPTRPDRAPGSKPASTATPKGAPAKPLPPAPPSPAPAAAPTTAPATPPQGGAPASR